jgi:hypothetical protein
VNKSRLVSLIDWVTVIRRYTPIVWYIVLTVLVGQIVTVLFAHRSDFQVRHSAYQCITDCWPVF